MVGLSGLITPSLEEMVTNGFREMERQGFDHSTAHRRRHNVEGPYGGEDRIPHYRGL